MVEAKYFLRSFILLSLFAILGWYLLNHNSWFYENEDVLINTYWVKLNFENPLQLEEFLIFEVKKSGKFDLLNRGWNLPLSVKKRLNKPSLRITKFTSNKNINWYVKDYAGKIYGKLSEKTLLIVKKSAERNSLGIININGFKSGNYFFGANYELYPVLNKKGNTFYTYITFVQNYFFIKKVRIEIEDKQGIIKDILPLMPKYKIEKTHKGYIIEGYSPSKGSLRIFFILKKAPFKAFFNKEDIKKDILLFIFVRYIYKFLSLIHI
jgi:hypothetical protein